MSNIFTFKFYEDANDTYNYEKGAYATFNFSWNDQNKELEISARKGTFPGMLQKRIFNIVIVGENKGTGVDAALQVDKIVKYDGKAVKIKL